MRDDSDRFERFAEKHGHESLPLRAKAEADVAVAVKNEEFYANHPKGVPPFVQKYNDRARRGLEASKRVAGEIVPPGPTSDAPPPREHLYGLRNRPAGPGTVPPGNTGVKPHEAFRHGAVAFNRPLTEKEQADYELTPIRHDDDIPDVARSVADGMGDYVGEYLKPENAELLDEQLSRNAVRQKLGHVNVEKVKAELHKQFGTPAEQPAPEVPAATTTSGREVPGTDTKGRERDVAKLRKEVAGTVPMSQPRATHGEVGPNGEVYPGGAFIATQDLPKRLKDKLKRSATGRVQTRDGYAVPEPGQMSIVDKLGGTVMNPRNGEVNEQYLDYIRATPEDRAMFAELAEKHKAGEKWASVNDYPKLANLTDAARLHVAGRPIPGAILDRLPAEYRERLTKYQAAKGGVGSTASTGVSPEASSGIPDTPTRNRSGSGESRSGTASPGSTPAGPAESSPTDSEGTVSGQSPSDTSGSGQPDRTSADAALAAVPDPPPRNPLMSSERQLDIFGGSSAQPRPAPPAVQPALFHAGHEVAPATRHAEEAFEGLRRAAEEADGAGGPAGSGTIGQGPAKPGTPDGAAPGTVGGMDTPAASKPAPTPDPHAADRAEITRLQAEEMASIGRPKTTNADLKADVARRKKLNALRDKVRGPVASALPPRGGPGHNGEDSHEGTTMRAAASPVPAAGAGSTRGEGGGMPTGKRPENIVLRFPVRSHWIPLDDHPDDGRFETVVPTVPPENEHGVLVSARRRGKEVHATYRPRTPDEDRAYRAKRLRAVVAGDHLQTIDGMPSVKDAALNAFAESVGGREGAENELAEIDPAFAARLPAIRADRDREAARIAALQSEAVRGYEAAGRFRADPAAQRAFAEAFAGHLRANHPDIPPEWADTLAASQVAGYLRGSVYAAPGDPEDEAFDLADRIDAALAVLAGGDGPARRAAAAFVYHGWDDVATPDELTRAFAAGWDVGAMRKLYEEWEENTREPTHHEVVGNTYPHRQALGRIPGAKVKDGVWTIPAGAAGKLPRGLSSRPAATTWQQRTAERAARD